MTSILDAAPAIGATPSVRPATADAPANAQSPPSLSFSGLLAQGIERVEQRIDTADGLARRFALGDDSIPIHEVTIALERARLTVELMTQVRTRLVEAYRDIMNMQL